MQEIPKDFSEQWYLKLNPGVAQAVEKRIISSGAEHYSYYGYQEKRRHKKPLFYEISDKINNIKFKNKFNVTGQNNTINCDTDQMRNVKVNISGNNNSVLIKGGAQLKDCTINIIGDNHSLQIGYFCSANSSIFGFEDNGCKIVIKDNTSIYGNCTFGAVEPNSSIMIGEDCMISINIDIRTSDSHSIIDLDTDKRINYGSSVSIGDHVWIGAHAKILKGVHIADRCIVAMSAIVNKKFMDQNCVIGGFPAKVLRRNIDWQRERIYDSEC